QVMDVIRMANLVNEDVCTPFGLSCILEEWKCRLKCKKDDTKPDDCKEPEKPKEQPCSEMDNACIVYPQLQFPISADPYLAWVKGKFTDADGKVKTASTDYLKASKEKEEIASRIASLKEAIAAADPKERCK